MKQCNTDIDTQDTLYSSTANVQKADLLMNQINELQDLEESGIITKSELKRMGSLTKNVIKLLKKGKKIRMEM